MFFKDKRFIAFVIVIIILALTSTALYFVNPTIKIDNKSALSNFSKEINIDTEYPKLIFDTEAKLSFSNGVERETFKNEYQTVAEDFSEGENTLYVKYLVDYKLFTLEGKETNNYKFAVDMEKPTITSDTISAGVLYTNEDDIAEIEFVSEQGAQLFYNGNPIGFFQAKNQKFDINIKDVESHEFWVKDIAGNESEKVVYEGKADKLIKYQDGVLGYSFYYPESWAQSVKDTNTSFSRAKYLTFEKEGFRFLVNSFVLTASKDSTITDDYVCTNAYSNYAEVEEDKLYRIDNYSRRTGEELKTQDDQTFLSDVYWYEKLDNAFVYKFDITKNEQVVEIDQGPLVHLSTRNTDYQDGDLELSTNKTELKNVEHENAAAARVLYNKCFYDSVNTSYYYPTNMGFEQGLDFVPANNLAIMAITTPDSESYDFLLKEMDMIASSFEFDKARISQ